MLIKLKRGLFEGNFPLSQAYGLHPEWYAGYGLKGHNGIDYATPTGTKLYSAISGTVTELALDKTGYGNYIKVENDECGILYGHMRELSTLKVGTNVKAGDLLGYSGNTGNSTGPHLHWGVFPKPRNRNNGYAGYIDPFDKKLVEWVDNYETGVSTDEITTLRKALEEMTSNKDEWKTKASEYETTIKELKKEIKTKDTDYQNLKSLCEELENKRNDLAILNANLNKEVSNITSDYKNVFGDLAEAQGTIYKLQSKQPEYTIKELLNLLTEKTKSELKKLIKY